MARDTPTVTSTASETIDASDPLYIHPSDNPSFTLDLVPFDGTSYGSWKRSVLRSLSVKNKLVFVTGEYTKPNAQSTKLHQWERCDDMVTSWILNSLSRDIADSVEYVSNSTELWKELDDRYDQTNGAKLYQIQKEINDLSQGVLDITGYYTRMKKLWEELSTLVANHTCNCQCTCGAKELMYKAERDRRLIQFLMGLNEVYTVIRGSILMMNPLPSMGQAFALLVQEEKQRELKPHNQMFTKSTTLAVNTSGTKKFRTDHFPNQGFNTNNYISGNCTSTNTSRPRPFYEYCKKPRHTKDKCYKLHGYPSQTNQGPTGNSQRNFNNGHNNRFNKGKGIAANAHAQPSDMNARKNEKPTHSNHKAPSLSEEHYDQLLDVLQHFNSSGTHSDTQASGAANFEVPFTKDTSGDW